MLFILNGHKNHVILEVLLKAKSHGVDIMSLLSYTSHELQLLDMSYFKPFEQSYRAFRDAWAKKYIWKKVGKQILAQWMNLALQRALTMRNIQFGFRATRI